MTLRSQEALSEGGRLFRKAGRGRKAFLEGREGSRGHPGGPAGVGSPSQRAERGRESLPEGRDGLGHSPVGLGGVGTPSWKAVRGRESPKEGLASRISGSGREALLEGRGVGRPSQKARRDHKTLPKGQVVLGGPPGRMERVERPSRMVGRGQEALL